MVALLNTNLVGPSLTHLINVVRPKHLIVAAEFLAPSATALTGLVESPAIWTHGIDDPSFDRIDVDINRHFGVVLDRNERRLPTIEDHALYIFTSGTTELPKAANISHARVMQWSFWLVGMIEVQPADRMYNCLLMYHSVGGVQATGAAPAVSGSVIIREKFSASQFWGDLIRWDCALFQYIGEFCRYLLHANPNMNAVIFPRGSKLHGSRCFRSRTLCIMTWLHRPLWESLLYRALPECLSADHWSCSRSCERISPSARDADGCTSG